jgi:perosamine synthetase
LIPIAKPKISDEEIRAVTDVLKSGMLAQGKIVEKLEQEFASYIGVNYAIATNSGTSALHTALAAVGITKGDEILTTDFSFVASATCALMQNAKPVFCDIDPTTYNISPEDIEKKITKKTKAILPVHLYGQSCDMDTITDLARDHDVWVVEDACQAHGAEYRGKKVGAIGDVGVFSFYPTKNMTTGEGGIVITDDEKIAERARMFRSHGQSKQYVHEFLGFNYRMTNIAAAIGLAQLEHLDEGNKRRQENAAFLLDSLRGVEGITCPSVDPKGVHVFHQFTIRIEDEFPLSRDELCNHLKEKGVGFGIHYPTPIHKQPLFEKLGYTDDTVDCPIAAEMSKRVLSLPVHPQVTADDLRFIVQTIHNVVREELWMSA